MRRPLSARRICATGLCAAVLLAVQIVLSPLPNIELVSLLVIVYTLALGADTLYIIYIFALLEGVVYGFGLWWFTYLYVWTLLYFAARALRGVDSAVLWAIIAAIFGLLFGTLTSVPYFITGGIGGGVAYILGGLVFDFLHCGGNFVLVLLLYRPLRAAMGRVASIFFRAPASDGEV